MMEVGQGEWHTNEPQLLSWAHARRRPQRYVCERHKRVHRYTPLL